MSGTGRGQTHIVVYLNDVTEEQVDQVMEGVCDVLASVGLGMDESDEESPVRALVGLLPRPFPNLGEDEATKRFLDEHARFAIPTVAAESREQER